MTGKISIMKIRAHRGSLAEAMKTAREIDPSAEAVSEFLREHVSLAFEVSPELITVEKYGSGVDERTGWDTHSVSLADAGIFAWTDGPLQI